MKKLGESAVSIAFIFMKGIDAKYKKYFIESLFLARSVDDYIGCTYLKQKSVIRGAEWWEKPTKSYFLIFFKKNHFDCSYQWPKYQNR